MTLCVCEIKGEISVRFDVFGLNGKKGASRVVLGKKEEEEMFYWFYIVCVYIGAKLMFLFLTYMFHKLS